MFATMQDPPPFEWASGFRHGKGERPDLWVEPHNSVVMQVNGIGRRQFALVGVGFDRASPLGRHAGPVLRACAVGQVWDGQDAAVRNKSPLIC